MYVAQDLIFPFQYNTDGVLSGIVHVRHSLLHSGVLSDILVAGVLVFRFGAARTCRFRAALAFRFGAAVLGASGK